ncbi:ABC transporter transmembrane domain-containing protein [Desulfobotulus sp. H1]|uniref:ABC transporter transmembrane domain-containing protein n=1 Tax=Desulfobotulus pelophilus TaxID=2823377 RepID=A0ABT3N9S4_9BACT|nr:ABC transporter transmembrane domain-containing protein [Desulfobotulus pelophilus]MCW7754210.1 ABC transporter transmembrane domain-containing protein [Desulfobotulus pelophilus]
MGFRLEDRHKKVLALVMESKWRLAIAMLSMFLVSLTTVASAWLIKPVLDDIFLERDMVKLYMIPIAVLVVFVIRGIGMYGQEFFLNYVGQIIIRHFRNALYDRIVDLPLRFFQSERTGVLMSRITNDVNLIRNMVSNVVTSSLRDFFTIIFLIVYTFYQIWSLALIAFLVLPAAFYPVIYFGRKVRKTSTGCQEAMADMNAFLHETFAGNKIVKAFGMETYEKKRFHEKTSTLFRLEIRQAIAKSMSSPVMEVLAGVGIAFIIWYGGSRVIEGAYTPGTFVSFLAAVLMLYDPVKKMSKLNNALQEGLAAVDRIFEILNEKSEIREKEIPLLLQDTKSYDVCFKNVSFAYTDDGKKVLDDISLEVRSGEVLALVGMSGGGKTSLVNLIPRFYDVISGCICIGGVDIRDFSLSSLRSRIAVVTQEPILFNDSIRANIAYGRSSATTDEIEYAARAAFAHDFICRMPNGYDTHIGELGSRLSGGEKQRICIARALVKDAPVLILDEATSALDTEAEQLVQKALDNLMQGRTTFVIAHRLSTITGADSIAVLVNGHLVEKGHHDALLAKNGAYAKLYRMQFASKEDMDG